MIIKLKPLLLIASLLAFIPLKSFAAMIYWNLFNIENESSQDARYVTYASLEDMLNDENRLGVFNPDGFGASANIVGSGSDGNNFWSLFNIEGESAIDARYVTYSSLADMLNDENRLGVFNPDGFGASANIVGSGSDGNNFWSLFNIEGESAIDARYVTYSSLADMLNDENRLGVFNPDGFGASANIVGSGSDGNNFWSLFNIEGESAIDARYVTYSSLADMLIDENRLGVFNPNGFGASRNIIGSGAFIMDQPVSVSEPYMLWLFLSALAGIHLVKRRKA
ncbi:MAG: hypothetical protein R3241_00830 [Rheinheimera sp.]|nr:hypothetical protein [Rheinheimera sp.]